MEYTTIYVTIYGNVVAVDFKDVKKSYPFDLNGYANNGWRVKSVVASDYKMNDILVYVLEKGVEGEEDC